MKRMFSLLLLVSCVHTESMPLGQGRFMITAETECRHCNVQSHVQEEADRLCGPNNWHAEQADTQTQLGTVGGYSSNGAINGSWNRQGGYVNRQSHASGWMGTTQDRKVQIIIDCGR